MDMMGILAQSMMVATRAETRVLMRDAPKDGEKRKLNRYFWQGRKWRPTDPGAL
jgi:hypothetical protein